MSMQGGKKNKNLVSVVCEQPPMTRFTNQPTFFETKQNNSLKMNM